MSIVRQGLSLNLHGLLKCPAQAWQSGHLVSVWHIHDLDLTESVDSSENRGKACIFVPFLQMRCLKPQEGRELGSTLSTWVEAPSVLSRWLRTLLWTWWGGSPIRSQSPSRAPATSAHGGSKHVLGPPSESHLNHVCELLFSSAPFSQMRESRPSGS